MNALTPNNSPFPSMLPNSPFFAPFAQVPNGEVLDLQPVPENAAISDPITHQTLTPLGPVNMLAALRQHFPYLPILPTPTFERTYYMVAEKPIEVHIPTGVVLAAFKGTGTWLLNTKGNADWPTAANPESTSVLQPDGLLFYVGNLRSVSIISPNTGTLVSVMGHRFTELPR